MSATKQPTENRPPRRRPRRRWLRVLAGCFALLLLVLLSFPLWSTWITPPLAKWLAGVEIGELESPRWTRWRVVDLTYQQEGLSVQAGTVELPSPSGWLLSRVFDDREPLGVTVENWSVALSPTQEPRSEAAEPPSPHALFEQINSALDLVHQQLGPIAAQDGEVQFDGQRLAQIERAAVDADGAELRARVEPALGYTQVELDRSDPQSWQILLQTADPEAAARLRIGLEGQQLAVQGDAQAFQNSVQLAARWDADTSLGLPDSAHVAFDHLQIDNQRFDFWPENLPLDLRGQATWSDGQYAFEIHSLDTARLQSDIAHTIDMAGSGDLQGARIETAHIELPWLTAENNAPLEFDFSLENPLGEAALDLTVDFQELPWVEGSGYLDTRLAMSTAPSGDPIILLTANSDRIELYDTTVTEVALDFRAEGKRLELVSLVAATARGSRLEATGVADLDTRTLERLSVQANLENESEQLQQLVPVAQWHQADLELTAEGPFADPNLDLALSADDIKLASLKPIAIQLAASGRLRELDAELAVDRAGHRLEAALSTTVNEAGAQATLQRFRLSDGGSRALELASPAEFVYQPERQRFEASGIDLEGPTAESYLRLASLKMGSDGLAASASARNLSTRLLDPWLETPAPPFELANFDSQLQLAPDQSRLHLSLDGLWHLNADNAIEASLAARQLPDKEPQLQIERLEVGSAGRSFFQAAGRFPLSLGWANGKVAMTLREDAPFSLAVDSSPNPDFWSALSDLLPVTIEQPSVTARFEGTLARPEGSAQLQLHAVRWSPPQAAERELALQDILVDIDAAPDLLRVTGASARLGNNRVEASGEVALRGAQVEDLLANNGAPRIEDYQAAVRLDATDLAALREWLPEFARTQGSLQAEATFEPHNLRATARFRNLSTRPMPPLGAFSEISGEITLENERLSIQSFSGLAEQSPFQLAGSVDLRNWDSPRYDLAFTSQEFPLVRQSGMLIESDIDVELVSGESEYPDIRGVLTLTKGLVLTEPELLAGSTKSSKQRPPYFSVSQDPFSQWGLNVEIIGDEFLRVSNSFFQGTLSTDFLLDGTLENPLLIGKATTNQGRIFFPATALRLTSGEAFITRERPSDIQLNARAEGSLYDYEISMEVTGVLEEPQIDITTNPALSQTEALVFITTGALPEQGGLAKQSASSIGLFLGKGLFRKLLPSDPNSSNRLRLEIGKDTSEQGRRTFEAAYQLSEDLAIEGEYNKNDEYNANLKWTFFER